MAKKSFKQDLFSEFARVGKALGNANRLELLEFLAQGERSVESLANVAGLAIANTSQHLQHLRQAGLVTGRKDGLKVYYSLTGNDVITLVDALRTVAQRHLAEVDKLVQTYLNVKDNLEPLPRNELITRAESGLVMVIDVRPAEEFKAGHLPNAVNVPLDELENRLKEFNPNQEIVAYCRGPHCILAFDAVEKLREHGLTAHRLEDGYPEWKTAGLPTE